MICPMCKKDVVKWIYKPNRDPAYRCPECDAAPIGGPQIIFRGEGWTKKGS